MVERKRIALSYTYNESWIGGTYYIENLIHALNALDDIEKPHIVVITNNAEDEQAAKNKLRYPYISFQLNSGEKNRLFQFINKVSGRLIRKNIFNQKIKGLDAVFPYYACVQQSLAKKKIYWIADFQEHFASEFFSSDTIQARKKSQLEIQASAENLILSSRDALHHFKQLYPQHTVKVSVLPFAVTHPDFSGINIAALLKKFDLPQRYFICPNQFWKHKNQIVVLKAVQALKSKGMSVTVAFTGNTQDYRNPEYFNELNAFVTTNKLNDEIKFLGFIDRLEQLQLMNNAVAIIQPSLFEGWSTVVEDAKCLNKHLVVSDINIHREQLENSSAQFFDPLNADDLANVIQRVFQAASLPNLFPEDTYNEDVVTFGRNFLRISS